MSNFHISKDGTARKCQAQTPDACRATKTGMNEHFETKEDAQKAYEEKMKEKGSATNNLTKRKDSVSAGNKRAEELLNKTKAAEKFDIEASLEKIAEHLTKAEKQMTPAQRKAYNIRRNREMLDKDRERIQTEANRRVALATELKKEFERSKEEGNTDGALAAFQDYNDVVGEIVDSDSKKDMNNPQNRKAYANNIGVLQGALEQERELLEKEIKRVESSGRLKKAFNKEFKGEQEKRLGELKSRLDNVDKTYEETESRERKLRKSEAKRKYDLLVADGFKQAKRFTGWNMSAHPQGPVIEYQCPDCYSVSKARAGAMSRSKDVGLKAGCRNCNRKILIPIKWN